jgi:hypothetical protein
MQIEWTEMSDPGAALRIRTAPIPEPYQTRIAEALDAGSKPTGSPPQADPK